MDTAIDSPTFDPQSIHVSFEERKWLWKQVVTYKLSPIIRSISNCQKSIYGSRQVAALSNLSSSSMVSEVKLSDQHVLYYSSLLNGATDSQIDQFRLHHQQLFQLIFFDLCKHPNYRILIIIIEGIVFYSSETVKNYKSLIKHEMNRFLSAFSSFIQSRSSKIIDLVSFLAKLSASCYRKVSLNNGNTAGILFQVMPKIRYNITSQTEYNSIMAVDEYKKHIVSLEELRFIDYSVNKKTYSIPLMHQTKQIASSNNGSIFHVLLTAPTGGLLANHFPKLHTLPIVYPYDDNMVYGNRYPSFWNGNNYKNAQTDVLFEARPVDKTSAEYLFVHRSFYETIPEKGIQIVAVDRIENPTLWQKFCAHRLYMQAKNGPINLNETWLFHGTNSDNHHNIITHGFNRSYCTNYVLYGRGVYFSRYSMYSMSYSDRKDVSFLFLCRVLVGYYTLGSNDIRIPPPITTSQGKSVNADSTTNKIPFDIVCTYHDDQNYPEYVITFMTK